MGVVIRRGAWPRIFQACAVPCERATGLFSARASPHHRLPFPARAAGRGSLEEGKEGTGQRRNAFPAESPRLPASKINRASRGETARALACTDRVASGVPRRWRQTAVPHWGSGPGAAPGGQGHPPPRQPTSSPSQPPAGGAPGPAGRRGARRPREVARPLGPATGASGPPPRGPPRAPGPASLAATGVGRAGSSTRSLSSSRCTWRTVPAPAPKGSSTRKRKRGLPPRGLLPLAFAPGRLPPRAAAAEVEGVGGGR